MQDIHYAVRSLRSRPAFTAVAVLTLAVGIGANTTIFSTVNAMLLEPFAFPQLGRVVTVWETAPDEHNLRLDAAAANFRDWREQSTSFSGLAAAAGGDANLTGVNVAEHVEGSRVTGDFFSVLALPAQLGRTIERTDFVDGAAPVVVLGYDFWRQHLGADPLIVGKDLRLNGRKVTVVGVAAEALDFPLGSQLWTPLDLSGAAGEDRSAHDLTVIGRLKDGVSLAIAQAELRNIGVRSAEQYPQTNARHGVAVRRIAEDFTADSRPYVLLLMGAAVFVLLLACANVTNLQLARASGRHKELALRAALGASGWRIARQLLVESLLLALLGSGGALLLSGWGMVLLRRTIPPFILEHIAGLRHFQIDMHVFLFTLLIAVAAGLLASLVPMWRFSRPDVNDALKEGARSSAQAGGRRLRAALVAVEIAVSLVLLVGAGLMVNGFRALTAADMGFDRNGVLTFHVALPESTYRDKEMLRGYYERALRGIEALPSVESVGAVTSLPAGWSWRWTDFTAEGAAPTRVGEGPSTISQVVTPGFFAALRVPLKQGRLLSAQDTADAAPVVAVSEALAQRISPNEDPLGKRIRFGRADSQGPWRTIVGVVGDVKAATLDRDAAPAAYIPLAQAPVPATAFVVRTSGDPFAIAATIDAQLRAIDVDQPPYDVRSLDQVVSDTLSGVESSARMMLIFGICALVLAAAGIFAVMAYSVAQRTHEIGVRMALGAQRADMLRLIVGGAMKIAGAGLAVGFALGLLMARVLSSVLVGVVDLDVTTIGVLTLALAAIAVLAAYVPARWAARVDPIVALRRE